MHPALVCGHIFLEGRATHTHAGAGQALSTRCACHSRMHVNRHISVSTLFPRKQFLEILAARSFSVLRQSLHSQHSPTSAKSASGRTGALFYLSHKTHDGASMLWHPSNACEGKVQNFCTCVCACQIGNAGLLKPRRAVKQQNQTIHANAKNQMEQPDVPVNTLCNACMCAAKYGRVQGPACKSLIRVCAINHAMHACIHVYSQQ